ncbi:MAG: site-specific DNA-methyltransferase [Mediterranea massiliensis]|nr:site-specific DNA-methyltransferase [Mediterranea massiliensis]
MSNKILSSMKKEMLADIDKRLEDKVLEPTNADLLKKLIINADNDNEAVAIAALGTTYKRTGLHFDKRLEKMDDSIKYFKKNEALSFRTDESKPTHKLIIGDNYEALQNLLIQYKGGIDVIYIDPPYGKDSMGEFAKTNYENAVTRDNLLSMLYPRLVLAKQLLSDSGVIFCSIDDRNQAYVKCLFDEVFGENKFLFNIPRITKKGGKTTETIQKNNDYILAYTLNKDILFSQEDKTDLSKYKYEDKYVNERGKYALTQTLDYNSLDYSKKMDFVIEFDGVKYIPGGNEKLRQKRLNGEHGVKDWTWRWGEDAVDWGKENDFFVIKNGRIYTKSYMYCRKKNGKCELEIIDTTKAYTTLSYLDNKYNNDNANKELNRIFQNGNVLFRNPKPSLLVSTLIKMVCEKEDAVILDFFAGSGTTGHAVLDRNSNDGGNRTFILCQLNEKTDTTPNGIAYDVTSKRLKRIMTGECYDGTKNFKWAEENKPYGENLDVYEIGSVANFEATEGKTPFDVIDETLYGKERFSTLKEKIEWVCTNFANAQKVLESEEEWLKKQ